MKLSSVSSPQKSTKSFSETLCLLWFLDVLIDPAARALQTAEALFFNPFSERGRLIAEFPFCRLRAAVFAEPAITQIEEVGRLVHRV